MAFISDQMCFACGRDNPIGLKLSFRQEQDRYVTSFTADPQFQGYHGIVHGGILATLLDEVMARYVWEKVGPSATAKLEVRYRRPAPTGEPLDVRGWITAERQGGRIFETAADIRAADGTVLAEATGLVMRVNLTGGTP